MGEDTADLKQAINNLIWEYAPSTLTLEQADRMALDILAMIENGVDIQGLQVLRCP